jgi:hypothetical protein
MFEAKSKNFFFNEFNQLIPVERDSRRKIFEYNNLTDSQIEECLVILETIDTMRNKCEGFLLLDLEELKNWLQPDIIQLNNLSLLVGHQLKIPASYYIDTLDSILEFIKNNENMHIGLVDREIHSLIGDLFFCCNLNGPAFIGKQNKDNTLGIFENTISVAIYYKIEELWMTIPRLKRNKNYVIQQILSVANNLGHNDGEYNGPKISQDSLQT